MPQGVVVPEQLENVPRGLPSIGAAGLIPLARAPKLDAPEPAYQGFLRTPAFAAVATAAGLIQASTPWAIT